jgi:hypothetical protein
MKREFKRGIKILRKGEGSKEKDSTTTHSKVEKGWRKKERKVQR